MKTLSVPEDERHPSAVPPRFAGYLRRTQWPTIISLRGNGAHPCPFYSLGHQPSAKISSALLRATFSGDVLPPGFNFVSGLTAALYMGGSPVTILPAGVRFIASFAIPAGMEGLNFTILYWDKSTGAWVELPDVMVTPEGFVTVTTDFVGIFVLATK